MGQYYIIVNPAKRQYLDPHNFGCGLKLMEFTNSSYGPQQALCVLLSNGNGNGGGDLGTDGLSEEEKALIGSWAGDPVIVAGDYGEPWKWVPEDLKGKTFTQKEELYRHSSGRIGTSDDMRSGSYSPTGKYKNVSHIFGKRKKDRETGELIEHDENLYSAARVFFEDISDTLIKIVAVGEGGAHPWAAMDLAKEGWRDFPEWGVLPEKEPKTPAGGKRLYKEYAKHAQPAWLAVADEMVNHLMRNPQAAEVMAGAIKDKLTYALKAIKERQS